MQRPLGILVRKSSVLVAPWLFLLALVLAGCDGPTTAGPADGGAPDAGPKACAPGELTREDGSCQKAGLPPDMPCPPGQMLLDGGQTCQKAGVPPSACGVGFLPDGKEGCEPILPADPCPVGQMAVPGDAACHEVSPCGSGTWGDIPVEANTQFVDKMYAGGNSDGTKEHPWTTIQQGVNKAVKGAIVAVAEGTYGENVLIQGKSVRLWGICPEKVTVAGTAVNGAIQILKKAAGGAEIHGVAVTGDELGIGVSGASGVMIEGVWVHDTGDFGINVEDHLGPTSMVLKGSLVDNGHRVGVAVAGSDVTIEASVVRSTLSDSQGKHGRGIEIDEGPETKMRAKVTVRTCLVEQNHEFGVYVSGSDATIEATVVRSTLPDSQGVVRGINIEESPITKARANVTVRACLFEQNQKAGVIVLGSDATIEATVVRSTLAGAPGTQLEPRVGIGVQDGIKTKARANVAIRACLVDQNHGVGVSISGSDATIEATVVRATLSDKKEEYGYGINIQDHIKTKARANVTIHACLVEQNHDEGVAVTGSDATIEATVVRSTLADLLGKHGRGISVEDDSGTKARANVTVHACLIEQNHELGVFISSSDATIDATVICSTLPNDQGKGGRGINIQDDDASANVTIRSCLVEKNHDVGIFVGSSVWGADVTIEATAVRDTASQSDNTFGDGIAVQEGKVAIRNVEVTHNARAGISNFGGQVVITGGVLSCNDVDLDGEPFNNTPFSFGDSSGMAVQPPAPCGVHRAHQRMPRPDHRHRGPHKASPEGPPQAVRPPQALRAEQAPRSTEARQTAGSPGSPGSPHSPASAEPRPSATSAEARASPRLPRPASST